VTLDPLRRAELLGLMAEQDAVAWEVRRRYAEASLADSLVAVTRGRRERTRSAGSAISGVGVVTALLGGAVAGSAATEAEDGTEDPGRVKSGETLALVGLGVAVLGAIVFLAAGQDNDADYDEALRQARVILQQRSVGGDPAVGVRLDF
jgi:hypothetical protein